MALEILLYALAALVVLYGAFIVTLLVKAHKVMKDIDK